MMRMTERELQAGRAELKETATILQFVPRPRRELPKPTLLDQLERQLFDDADP